MLRILLLFLILRCAAAASLEDTEGATSGDFEDEEVDEVEEISQDKKRMSVENTTLDESKGEETGTDWTMVIIIAGACLVALAVVAFGGTFFFRRYLRSQEQGVYSMPAEQVQKAAV